jgi:hypothetical protein
MARKPRYVGAATREAYSQHLLSLGTRTEGGCLEWRYASQNGGYGVINPPDTPGTMLLTRYVVEARLGRVLHSAEQVMHHCDNPPCYNPEHLTVGTNLENQRDADLKGRSNRRARLIVSDEQVAVLRELARSTDLTQRELGVRFGLHQTTISKILSNKARV